MKFKNPELAFAFRQTIPVLLGYIAIGLAFGLMLAAASYPWWLAFLMCLIVYAGAAQYMAVGFFTANIGLAETALLTLLVNARHMVYGVSLLDRFRGMGAIKAYLIFALTDETYALLTSFTDTPELDRKKVYTYISALDQSYWIVGGLIGALAGSFLPIPTAGLGFALTALFAVLLVEQIRSRINQPSKQSESKTGTELQRDNKSWQRFQPFYMAGASCVLSLIFFGSKNMLLPAIIISIILLLTVEFTKHRQTGVAN